MSWNKEKCILMVGEMASKCIFESKSGSRERGAIWYNIADNLNNFEEFALTAQSLPHEKVQVKNETRSHRYRTRG